MKTNIILMAIVTRIIKEIFVTIVSKDMQKLVKSWNLLCFNMEKNRWFKVQ